MKRGQAPAAGAAILVAIIGIVLISFIVLLDPAERDKILDEDFDGTTTSGSDDDIEEARADVELLEESPGRIDYLSQNEIEHPLPTVNIYTKTESEVLAEKSSAFASKSVFSEQSGNFKFALDDLGLTDNALLAFEVKGISGRLIISLNGENIFDGETSIGNPAPIKLPKNFLTRENNELVFRVSSPGIALWATNKVILENIKIVADVTDVEVKSSKHTFLVSETEKNNLESAKLKFEPDCRYEQVGPLKVVLNSNELYNAVPDCDLAFVPIEFSPDLLVKGENEIVFTTSRGTYLLSHVVVESDLGEVDFPTYYFDLSQEEYDEVQAETRRVRLKMDFVDVVNSKYGEVVFNGYQNHFDTRESSVSLDVSEDVLQGTNSVKIKPRKTIEVRELRVDLVK
jgi:hypothetical protein